jgi:hypothetical protein
MDIAALTAELDADPEGLGYSKGLTAQENADLINAVGSGSDTLRNLMPLEIVDEIGVTAYTTFRERTRSTVTAIAATADVVIDMMNFAPEEGLSIAVGSPFRDALLAAGIPAGVATALITLATVEQSRADELGLGVVGDGHVRSCVGWEAT